MFLDTSQLWGTDPSAKKAQRASDGTHNFQHWPVYLLLLPRLSGLGDWGGAAVAIGVSLVAAAATKRLVEEPVRF